MTLQAYAALKERFLVFMPYPERAFYWWQQPDWTRRERMPEHGDGKLIFESLIGYLEKKS